MSDIARRGPGLAQAFRRVSMAAFAVAALSYSAFAGADKNARARELAQSAYFRIEANVFFPEELEKAQEMIEQAYELNPKEPYTRLAASLAILVDGYRIGDWYDRSTFDKGTVERAIEKAREAIALDRGLAQSYAHLARLCIIEDRHKDALDNIRKAKELDRRNFYPWYFEGIVYETIGNARLALKAFAEAEKRVALKHHRRLLNGRRQNVAEMTNNFVEQERLLKENIANEPDDPYVYGNYAFFLKHQKRYDESVVQWENALKRGRYRHAEEQLEETKRLRKQQNFKWK